MSQLVLAFAAGLPALLGRSAREGATRTIAMSLLASRAALVTARSGAGTDSERCAAARAGLRVVIPGRRKVADLAARVATSPHCEGDSR